MSSADARRLFQTQGPVDEIEFDEEFAEHMASRRYQKHDVTTSEILEAHWNGPRYFENAGAGRAPIILVGRTIDDRYIVVPLEPTGRWGRWRAVTAFEANAHHRTMYEETSND